MDPVLLNVFGLEIRWYGLLMVIAFICGYYILLKIRDDVSKEYDPGTYNWSKGWGGFIL